MFIISLLLVFVFFLLAAFFSGIETGLISFDRIKLENEAKKDKKKKQILDFLENPNRLFGTTLFGTNISIVIVSSLSVFLFHYLSEKGNLSVSQHSWTLILTILILIFAEIIPKALYREIPNKLVTRSFSFLKFFSVIFTPFVKFVEALNSLLANILHLEKENSFHLISKEDLSFLLADVKHEEEFQEDQRDMLEDALEFSELKAENVMIHRTEIVALSEDATVDEIIKIAKKEGYTRFPVYKDNLDNITGILIIYDLLKKKRKENLRAADFVREAYFAPETMNVNTLLTEMQTKKKSMAIIVDAYGGTAGLVTIEDILEEIVGEIEDEYDIATQEVKKIDDKTFLVQGFVEIDFLNDEYEMNLPEGDYETIAGLIIDRIARIPTGKTKIKVGDWLIEIVQVTNKKIEKVLMKRIRDESKRENDDNQN
ncbi:MAG: hypothetical protein B6D62_01390 [Candidatus Cloacimonas sp. 4484_275]|nr:MAG: hypothetical protein B6D62_01390 [Candidatus Cloacimonas sp. 4484_275]RLC51573.1 MAG: HlyC/CorC family transporter [Candidatus Cloacimonadota bacterium]